MLLEYVADRLVADGVPEIRERSCNAVIAPGGTLLGHLDHELGDVV